MPPLELGLNAESFDFLDTRLDMQFGGAELNHNYDSAADFSVPTSTNEVAPVGLVAISKGATTDAFRLAANNNPAPANKPVVTFTMPAAGMAYTA